VSRLARNNADWHRLLEICALADTLILDEDGVYDPASFNDRLLLGLKGTMSEAELHVIKARLRGGILNKVRRGEYRCALPTGFVYDDPGNVVLDPDSQIRETVAYFFATFTRVGSACQTVKVFRDGGLLFPSRLRNSATTVFRPLTASTAIRTLNNPRYAGAYLWPAALSASRRWQKDPAKAGLQRLARLHPERSSRLHHLGAIPAKPQNPREQR
jgi:DNA invertase Pin-like site-specific DNA recombinase